MKTPIYETSAGATAALLATRQFQWVGLYKFQLVSGNTYYYTTGDVPLTFGGNTYLTASQTGVIFERKGARGKVKWRLGLEVDTMQFDAMPNGGQVNGKSFFNAVRQGDFDGADFTFMHAYWPSNGGYVATIQPTGVVVMFAGRPAGITWGRSMATFTINSYLDVLNQQLPRNIYQLGCINTLYDSACTLAQNSYREAGVAAAGSTSSVVLATLNGATDVNTLGKIVFTSGQNNAVARSIKQYTKGAPGTIALMYPLPFAPAAGDSFYIYQGCDKALTTCQNKFGNQANFRGFPFIPENSTAV